MADQTTSKKTQTNRDKAEIERTDITPTNCTTLKAALKYLSLGISVIPVTKAGKTPLIKWAPYQKRLPTEEEVYSWWKQFPSASVGIVTGQVSNLVVVDFDSPSAIQFAREKNLLDTPLVKTARGIHAYYSYPMGKKILNAVNILGLKIDIRSDGGFVVAPPSVHSSGHIYQWVPDKELGQIPLKELPDIFIETSTTEVQDKSLKELYKGVPQGERNTSLTRLVGSWINDGLSYKECLEMALLWNQQNDPPMSVDEVERTVKSIFETHKRNTIRNPVKKLLTFFGEDLLSEIPLFVYNEDLVHKPQTIKVTNDETSQTITIHPSLEYGLPGEFDESVFVVILKDILQNRKNPVSVGSLKQIACKLGITTGGTILTKIKESIQRLSFTQIELVKNASQKRTLHVSFHFFDIVTSTNETLSDGSVIEENLVWVNPLVSNSIALSRYASIDPDVYISLPSGLSRGLYGVIAHFLKSGEKTIEILYSTLQKRLQFKRETSLPLVEKQLSLPLGKIAGKNIIKDFHIKKIPEDFLIEIHT